MNSPTLVSQPASEALRRLPCVVCPAPRPDHPAHIVLAHTSTPNPKQPKPKIPNQKPKTKNLKPSLQRDGDVT